MDSWSWWSIVVVGTIGIVRICKMFCDFKIFWICGIHVANVADEIVVDGESVNVVKSRFKIVKSICVDISEECRRLERALAMIFQCPGVHSILKSAA